MVHTVSENILIFAVVFEPSLFLEKFCKLPFPKVNGKKRLIHELQTKLHHFFSRQNTFENPLVGFQIEIILRKTPFENVKTSKHRTAPFDRKSPVDRFSSDHSPAEDFKI